MLSAEIAGQRRGNGRENGDDECKTKRKEDAGYVEMEERTLQTSFELKEVRLEFRKLKTFEVFKSCAPKI